MGYDFFEEGTDAYHVSEYFFRVEFQQRGAPHIHSLLWLKNKENKDAPNFWIDPHNLKSNNDQDGQDKTSETDELNNKDKKRMEEIEKFADLLITTSSDDIKCENHESNQDNLNC